MAQTGTVQTYNSEQLWTDSFQLLYNTTFQQFASARMSTRWHYIDTATSIMVTGTASSSAIAGWALWSSPPGKLIWIVIAGITSVTALVHTALQVPAKMKIEDALQLKFQDLHFDIDTFRLHLRNGMLPADGWTTYGTLADRFKKLMQDTSGPITFTYRLRKKIKADVDRELNSQIRQE